LVSVWTELRQSPSPLPPPLQVAPEVLTLVPEICAHVAGAASIAVAAINKVNVRFIVIFLRGDTH
jgi:hypothetical protein